MTPSKSVKKPKVNKSTLKKSHKKLETAIRKKNWLDKARASLKSQKKRLKNIKAKPEKLVQFIENQKKELSKIQKAIPSEIKKIQAHLSTQKADLEKMVRDLKPFSFRNKTEKKPTANK